MTTPTSTPSTLQEWMSKYQGYASLAKANAAKFDAALKAEKKKKHPNSERISYFTKQSAAVKSQLGHWNDQIADTQNKIYVQTGQYDKLLKGTERDAFMAVQSLFKTYGLDSLAGKIYDYTKNGYSPDTISILLQDSPEYKARFVGNDARVKAGLPVLSPAEYLSTEASYKQIMQSAGMPIGFYDQPGDFASWIGNDVSPTEVQSRVDLATQASTLANPDYKKALNQMGISDSAMTAYFLDSKKSLPLIQKQAATAQIGAQALHQGLGFDETYAGQLATEGITGSQAAQGYSQIATQLQGLTDLGNIYGQKWGQRESEQAVFEGDAAAINKQQQLVSREQSNFAGSAGAAASRGGLSQVSGAQ